MRMTVTLKFVVDSDSDPEDVAELICDSQDVDGSEYVGTASGRDVSAIQVGCHLVDVALDEEPPPHERAIYVCRELRKLVPELWGDDVIDGKVALRLPEEIVMEALAATSKY